MRILEYVGLDASSAGPAYSRVIKAIAAGDFRAAQVKKLSNQLHGRFYRARLNDADRLLFTFVRREDEVCVLILEIIANHAYDRSRFLRGAPVDEDRIPDIEPAEAFEQAQVLRYLHPSRPRLHLLDKPISFDDAQQAIFSEAPPLILIGGAGSGKTALTLEKLKLARGDILYVTHSAFLAKNARDLYFANGFEPIEQDVQFLSLREFIESIHVPPGHEAHWRDFAAWFARMRQQFGSLDPHQCFEEIRGVLGAARGGVLDRQTYLALGVRQSIFDSGQRQLVYDLFEKYCDWLNQAGLYDLNLIAHAWLGRTTPRFDFVVIDEVQDLTPVQLALVLRCLRHPDQFLLCGDSNQIVHPNFFSWSKVKQLFWHDPALAEQQQLRVLTANFRNGQRITGVANRLLKVKHSRFGSIDRESNYLVDAVGAQSGQVCLLTDREAVKRDLDRQTRQSTRFAVLVMRDEDKQEARKYFQTPLLFSVHEAKGLEYENVVLFRFVSDHRAEYAEVADGVSPADLNAAVLEYHRARNKQDKSLEIYKFYVNSLYVALTRAVVNVYWIESDTSHPILDLLDVRADAAPMQVQAHQSSREEWQQEAYRLELQGKQEQADAIRQQILKHRPVPWPVFDESRSRELLVRIFRDQQPGSKSRQQLLEIATCHDLPELASALSGIATTENFAHFATQRVSVGRKSFLNYSARNFKDILRQCDQHGVNMRLPMNQTPLMAAAASGNIPLVEALLEQGADLMATDHFGLNALHWALRAGLDDPSFARGPLGSLYPLLVPSSLDLNDGNRLVRLDPHLSEYLLLQTLWVLTGRSFTCMRQQAWGVFDSASVLAAWEHLPPNILRPERHKRQHISNVLSRNEVNSSYACNRRLFRRYAHGWYQFNPQLSIRRQTGQAEQWVPVYQSLNLRFIKEFAFPHVWPLLDQTMQRAGLPAAGIPAFAERAVAQDPSGRRFLTR